MKHIQVVCCLFVCFFHSAPVLLQLPGHAGVSVSPQHKVGVSPQCYATTIKDDVGHLNTDIVMETEAGMPGLGKRMRTRSGRKRS